MRILATRQFIDQARRAPPSQKKALARLLDSGPGPGPPQAKTLPGDALVGVSRDLEQVNLWYLVPPPPSSEAEEPPLTMLAKSELRALGVPDEALPAVYRARSVADLANIDMAENVRDMLAFQMLQVAVGLEAREPDLVGLAPDKAHMADFLHGRVSDLLLNLDEEQERVVCLKPGGNIVVRGVAGSGKTAVLLHRIRHLAVNRDLFHEPAILFLTYNRSLAAAARQLLKALGGAAVRNVTVSTFHGWCKKFAGIGAQRLARSDTARAELGEAIREVRQRSGASALWSCPLDFWQEEIHRIKGAGLDHMEEYLKMARHGAGRPLPAAARERVWEVHEAFVTRCRSKRLIDWDDVVRAAHDKMVFLEDAAPRFDFVFLDETQDLTPCAIRVAARLARPPGELFAAFDAAQSIYERGFRWKEAGVKVHGARSFSFLKNHRNTQAVLDAALAVLRGTGQEDGDDVLPPQPAMRPGTPPMHVHCKVSQEAGAIAAEIERLLQSERVHPGNIAVLAYPNRVKSRICENLRKRGVICQEHGRDSEIRLADPSVKVLPMKSSKGLEFPVVFLVASGGYFLPPRTIEEPAERDQFLNEMRRLFYVAMTRAMAKLVLVYPAVDPPPFLRGSSG